MKLKKGYLLYLLIFSSIVVIAWIAFNVYQTTITSTVSEKTTLEILPIKPNFDQAVIDNVKKREQITSLYEYSIETTPSQPPSPPARVASSSANSGGDTTL